MTPLAFAPLALCIAGAFGARTIVRSLNPRWATGLLCAVSIAASASIVSALVLLLAAAMDDGIARHPATRDLDRPGIALVLEWCGDLYDHRVPAWAGLAAAAILIFGTARAVASRRRWRAATIPWRGSSPLQVIPGPSTVAFAVPGGPGTVVVGQGLLEALEPEERRVVLTHERAHLDHSHHRYLQLSEAAAAAFPFLGPIADQVRYATERWADEVTARTVGDRKVVARAIIKAALISTPDTTLPAAASGPVSARVDALLAQPRRHRRWTLRGSLLSVMVTLAAASVQVHHLGVYLSHATH